MRREELAVRGSAYVRSPCALLCGQDFCLGEDRKPYRCEIGYCCGDSECCTYYYELWWFWLAWALIILAGCCCAYRHRRVKLRHQQELRQHEISLMAYQGVAPSAAAVAALEHWPACKLPTYEEVTQDPPTPPPPYSENFEEPDREVLPATSSDVQPSLQEGESPVEVFTEDEHQSHHDTAQESASVLERRRHITGDSGIVMCDEKVVSLNEREEEADLCMR
ncbi:WW domain-binding protein 1-like [Gastrophryne carolinensis]